MAISNYSELQAAVANWINRDDLTTVIPDFIRLAESRIATDLKTQHLITESTITTDASSKSASATGKPLAYTLKGNSIHFMPTPDSSYSCIVSHYTTPDLATDTTNTLLTNYPDLYLFASIVEALEYIEQDSTRYETRYQKALLAADAESDYLGALAIHVGDI